jgi:predicted ATPase
VPELLRIKGELTALAGLAGAREAAVSAFESSIALAMEQGARSWALRTATSLARLQAGTDKAKEAVSCLASVYEQFEEGFATHDLLEARRLLSDQ